MTAIKQNGGPERCQPGETSEVSENTAGENLSPAPGLRINYKRHWGAVNDFLGCLTAIGVN